MKTILILFLCVLVCNACEHKKTLVKQTSTDLIEDSNFTIKKSSFLTCWKDAADFVALVKDPEVCKFLFVAEASPEETDKIACGIRAKLSVAFQLAIGSTAFPRWIIKQKSENVCIGSIMLSDLNGTLAHYIKNNADIDPHGYKNFGIALKKSEWGKGLATQIMNTFLASIFASNEYSYLKGIVFCTNRNNQNGLRLVQNPLTQQVKKPYVYCGELNFPKGFCSTLPKACIAQCFTMSKEDFLEIYESNRTI